MAAVRLLRVLDYAMQAFALFMCAMVLARQVREAVRSESLGGRLVSLIACGVSLTFVITVAGGFAALLERSTANDPLNWRDWFIAIQYVCIIGVEIAVVRSTRIWNPDQRTPERRESDA